MFKRKSTSSSGNGGAPYSGIATQSNATKAQIIFNYPWCRRLWFWCVWLSVFGTIATAITLFSFWYNRIIIAPFTFAILMICLGGATAFVLMGMYVMANEHQKKTRAAGNTSARLSLFAFQTVMNNMHHIAGWLYFFTVTVLILWAMNRAPPDVNNLGKGRVCGEPVQWCLDRVTEGQIGQVYDNGFTYADLSTYAYAYSTFVVDDVTYNTQIPVDYQLSFYVVWQGVVAGTALLVTCIILCVFWQILSHYVMFGGDDSLEASTSSADYVGIVPPVSASDSSPIGSTIVTQ